MSKNILRDYPTPPKDCYKVYVRSCTYNQAPYIEDCLNGVADYLTNLYPLLWNNNRTKR